jgi:hypothetical protein
MATLQEYKDAAPTVMTTGQFTVTQIENKLSSIPTEPKKAPDPEITKEKVIEIFNDIFSQPSLKRAFEKFGGYGKLAEKYGLRKHQVKTVISELQDMLSIYRSNIEV